VYITAGSKWYTNHGKKGGKKKRCDSYGRKNEMNKEEKEI
jgi:hypothetical protein